MFQVRRHAVQRFRQRVSLLPEQEVVCILMSALDDAPVLTSDVRSRTVATEWQGISYTLVVAGSTILTCWRE